MNEIVKYNNYMNALKFTGFTVTDFNFLIALCSRMRDKDTNEIIFSFAELRSITEYKKSNSIKQFVTDIKKMNEKLMKITCSLETETEIIMFVLFPTFIINLNEQTLTVAVNEKFKFILNELVKNFTRFELKDFISLQSKYSKTLFRLLKQFKSTGILDIGLNDFITKMDIPKSYRIKDITDKIINPSLKELRNCFIDLQCTVQYAHKRGKPVSGYIFTFTPEQTPKPAPTEFLVETARPSKPQKELTQEEKDKLISEFGTTLTKKYIEKTKSYKSCNYDTIRKWISEDKDRDKNKKPKSSNRFNNFPQREVTQEELDDLEKLLLEKSINKF